MNIKNLLDDKGYGCQSIAPGELMEVAVKHMMESKISSLAVVENDEMVGIITERDVLHTVYHEHVNIHSTPVGEVMSKDPVSFDVNGTVRDAMNLMLHNDTGKRIRHLPVTEEGKLVGMVTVTDLMKRLIQETEFENRIMKNYIQKWPEEEVEPFGS